MAQSWFSDPELMTTNFSVSNVCSNLSKLNDTMAYAHMDDVVVVNGAQTPCVTHKLPIAEKSFIHQVRICSLQGNVCIVVASDNGVQIFDDKGEQSLYELALKNVLDVNEEGNVDDPQLGKAAVPAHSAFFFAGVAVFCRGIAAINLDQPSLIVGTSLGKLFVLGTEKSSKATSPHEFDLLETLNGHEDAISCIDGTRNGSLVACCDDSGLILVRNPSDSFEIMHRIEGDGFPVTSISFSMESWLICGFLTGRMRIFKTENGFHLHAEVSAHTRAITALDVHEHHVATVSEDTFLNVWELASKSSARVKLVSSQCVQNDLLTGVVFAGAKSIITAAYDTAHLKLWVPE